MTVGEPAGDVRAEKLTQPLTYFAWLVQSRTGPKDMRTRELALPLAGCGIGWASQSRAGKLTLVVWVQVGRLADQLRCLLNPDPGL